LVPVPRVNTLAELNEFIAAADAADDGRVITGRPVTVGSAFTAERPVLRPLPVEVFDPARQLLARVDKRARVCLRQCYYSVPARFMGRRLPVRLSAGTVEVFDGATLVARHERAFGRYIEVLALDHYLEVLRKKPGALPGATALAQAKASGVFTATHQQYWDALRAKLGDGAGTRALIEVLLAHRSLPAAAVQTAMGKAIEACTTDPQAVIIEARRLIDDRLAPLVPIGELARYDRPAPTLTGYDELLTDTGRGA
jgi:hypothetical protein